MMLLACAVAGGCSTPASHAPAPDLAQPPPDLAEPPLPVVSAMRCEECHGGIAARWRLSAHARADRAPVYLAMRARAGDAAGCEKCHAPFVGHADPTEPGAHEGVNCDTCHSIREVNVQPHGATFALATRENVKYGPLCDAKDHYFHKMGCSPLHAEGKLCAACHLYYRTVGRAALPVFTEYEEWQSGPADEGLDCQDCHMPGIRGAEVARGWKPARPLAHDHALLGRDGNLRRRALKLELALEPGDGVVHVTATLTNVGAGHAVPSGLPGRRIILRLSTLDAAGSEQSHDERQWARVLGDDAGRERPFYAATRLVRDDRLAPHAPRKESFDLAAPKRGTLWARVVLRELPSALSDELGVAVAEETLLETRVPLPARAKGSRPPAPQVVTVEPSR